MGCKTLHYLIQVSLIERCRYRFSLDRQWSGRKPGWILEPTVCFIKKLAQPNEHLLSWIHWMKLNASIGIWSTNGLTPGNYLLRLLVKNNFGDSIESIKPVYLAPSLLSISNESEISTSNSFSKPTDGQFYFEIYANRHSDIEITIRNIPGDNLCHSGIKLSMAEILFRLMQ